MGLLRKNETNNFKCRNITWLEYQLVEGEPVGYLTNMVKDLNSRLPRTNKLAIRVGLELRASELKVQHTKFLYQEKMDK